jgi:type I restriction modification DNA specificity protein
VRLGDLAQEIRLGRPGDEFSFPTTDNAFYIALIGISDVVDSTEAMTLKRQNYAQVVVDATRSDARFVARFLNSELGRAIRKASKSGTTIPKLNTSGLKELPIFVPNLATQEKILDIAARLAAEQNTLLGLQNDLEAMHRELWNSPDRREDVDSRLRAFSVRPASNAAPHVSETLDQWLETLPFPLASILRAW